MRDNSFTGQLHRRLLELGCPLKRARRLVQEVADHREDLKQAALSEGLHDVGAETRADVQLGDPLLLADQLMATLRRSSWWGRHFVITFSLLPFLAVPVLWILILMLELLLEYGLGSVWYGRKLYEAVNKPEVFHHFALAFRVTDYSAIALVALLFCWLARRSVVGLKWMAVSCGICSLYALITWGRVEPHSFALGFTLSASLNQQWIRAAIPLMIAGAFYVFPRRRTRGFVAFCD